MNTKMLTTAEAARSLGVSPSALRYWTEHYDIPYIVLPSGHRRFTQASIGKILQYRNAPEKELQDAQN